MDKQGTPKILISYRRFGCLTFVLPFKPEAWCFAAEIKRKIVPSYGSVYPYMRNIIPPTTS